VGAQHNEHGAQAYDGGPGTETLIRGEKPPS